LPISLCELQVQFKFKNINKSQLFNKNAAIHLHELSQLWFSFYISILLKKLIVLIQFKNILF